MSAHRIPGYIDSEGRIHADIPEGMRNIAVVVVVGQEAVQSPEERGVLPPTRKVGDLLKFWGKLDDPTMQAPEDPPPQERDFGW